MALSAAAAANIYTKWVRENYFEEYVRDSGFGPYMGKALNKPIVTKRELVSGGQSINIPLVKALRGAGTGTGTLVGNEEAIDAEGYSLKPFWRRHAVVTNEEEEHINSFDMMDAMKSRIRLWSKDDLRDKIVDGLNAVVEDATAYDAVSGHGKQKTYAEASAAQRNTYCANNADRLLFGNATSNYNTTMATALGNVTSAMTLDAEAVSLMKRIAKARNRSTGRPSIHPITVKGYDKEYFVLFCGSNTFADLKQDDKIQNANKDARPREVSSNPLFQDGDLIYDGVFVREIPEIASVGTVGAESANVAPVFLCGAQALGLGWGSDPVPTTRKEDDYQFLKGVGIKEKRAVEKLFYDNRQHGMVTGFFGSSADLT